jgi:hypothetical protein
MDTPIQKKQVSSGMLYGCVELGSVTILNAPLGHFFICSIIMGVDDCLISIQGLRRGSNTAGKPLKQIPECLHKEGCHKMVISPLE